MLLMKIMKSSPNSESQKNVVRRLLWFPVLFCRFVLKRLFFSLLGRLRFLVCFLPNMSITDWPSWHHISSSGGLFLLWVSQTEEPLQSCTRRPRCVQFHGYQERSDGCRENVHEKARLIKIQPQIKPLLHWSRSGFCVQRECVLKTRRQSTYPIV